MRSQARYEEAQACGSRNASTYGPAEGSSEIAAGKGPRSKGMGLSKVMTVEEGEYSSRLLGAGDSIAVAKG